ncbi:MAG: ABC transporter substrate-binding protein [Candidatus Taylorbacteria bacterium]
MNKKIIWSVIGLAIIIIVIISVIKRSPVPQANANPIKIGAVLSLTGDAAPWGEYGKNGINLAVKQINAAGGINGRQVQVVIEDDHTDGKQGVSAWNKLVTVDGVQGVIGGVFDFTAQPLIPLALSSNIPFISPSNFRIVGGFDLNDQSFVMLTDFNKTILKLQPYIASSSVKKLAVVHFKSTFGGEIAKTLDGVMKDIGRGGIIDTPYNQIGNNDFKTIIIKLKSQGVDGVFLDMVANDPLIFLTQAKQLGFMPTVITYNGALDAFANETDKSPLDNAVILNWEITTPQFTDLYQKEYGIPPTKSADKYFDAVYVMASSLANVSDPSQAASYIDSHSFTTPNSTISFTANHAVQDSHVEVEVMKNGTLVSW